MTYRVKLYHWRQLPYREAWEQQERLAATVRQGGSEVLVFVEHPPVYTFGRRMRPEHLLVDPATLRDRGAEVIESDRGGDITFHGPGQIVCYPILDLKQRELGPSAYVRNLEETVIRALASLGIASEREPGRPGVWIEGRKIAAIGVRLRGGVTTHGFAVNVNTDLSWFDAIVPCGLSGAGVTSVSHFFGGGTVAVAAVEDALVEAFEGVFHSRVVRDAATSIEEREVALAHGH